MLGDNFTMVKARRTPIPDAYVPRNFPRDNLQTREKSKKVLRKLNRPAILTRVWIQQAERERFDNDLLPVFKGASNSKFFVCTIHISSALSLRIDLDEPFKQAINVGAPRYKNVGFFSVKDSVVSS